MSKLFSKGSEMKRLLENTITIDFYYQIPGIPTSKILEKKLYSLKDRTKVQEIVQTIKLRRMRTRIQCKASNYIVFNLKDSSALQADIDPEGTWLRVTTPEGDEFYRIDTKSARLLLDHIEKAKSLYEREFAN